MNRGGNAALEALIASALILVLLTVFCSQLLVFWQVWRENTEAGRRRQWTALAFEHLDRDLAAARQVMASASELKILLPAGECVYRVSPDKSFYRGAGSKFSPLAMVDSARWWREGNLIWIELIYPQESYRCCYHAPLE